MTHEINSTKQCRPTRRDRRVRTMAGRRTPNSSPIMRIQRNELHRRRGAGFGGVKTCRVFDDITRYRITLSSAEAWSQRSPTSQQSVLSSFYFTPAMGAKYCGQHVCLSLCLSVCLSASIRQKSQSALH